MAFDPHTHPPGGSPDEPGKFSVPSTDEADVRVYGVGQTWPAHTTVARPWRQAVRGGSADDRKLRELDVMLPPLIEHRECWLSPGVTTAIEDGIREIVALDKTHGSDLDALEMLLLRTESVASSKIEHVEANADDYARALHGIKSNPSAVSMAAATEALTALIHTVDDGQNIELAAITRAHRALMADDRYEQSYAGRMRDVQNWIGGSDHSPRNALYVPPPPENVDHYMRDVVNFSNRTDISVLAQAAIAHAQFESIHPFTDGNGRIGRALINTILRRRGVTTRVVVPLASALVAQRDHYFDALGAYREGRIEPIISAFAVASGIAARQSQISARRIADFPANWRDTVGPVRRGSATERLLGNLASHPVFSADTAQDLIGGATSSIYTAIDRLHEVGILRPLTQRSRSQVWGASDMLDELDDLGVRIAADAHRQH